PRATRARARRLAGRAGLPRTRRGPTPSPSLRLLSFYEHAKPVSEELGPSPRVCFHDLRRHLADAAMREAQLRAATAVVLETKLRDAEHDAQVERAGQLEETLGL